MNEVFWFIIQVIWQLVPESYRRTNKIKLKCLMERLMLGGRSLLIITLLPVYTQLNIDWFPVLKPSHASFLSKKLQFKKSLSLSSHWEWGRCKQFRPNTFVRHSWHGCICVALLLCFAVEHVSPTCMIINTCMRHTVNHLWWTDSVLKCPSLIHFGWLP